MRPFCASRATRFQCRSNANGIPSTTAHRGEKSPPAHQSRLAGRKPHFLDRQQAPVMKNNAMNHSFPRNHCIVENARHSPACPIAERLPQALPKLADAPLELARNFFRRRVFVKSHWLANRNANRCPAAPSFCPQSAARKVRRAAPAPPAPSAAPPAVRFPRGTPRSPPSLRQFALRKHQHAPARGRSNPRRTRSSFEIPHVLGSGNTL